MHLHSETLLDQSRQFCETQHGLSGARLVNKLHDLGRELVCRAGAALLRDQSPEADPFESRLGLVERGARKTKGSSGSGYGILDRKSVV